MTAPIVTLVTKYTEMEGDARSILKGRCPFDLERGKTFWVHPRTGLFFCSYCRVGGDTLTFLMKKERMTYPEATKRLAQLRGEVK